jgi:hypothetical protein
LPQILGHYRPKRPSLGNAKPYTTRAINASINPQYRGLMGDRISVAYEGTWSRLLNRGDIVMHFLNKAFQGNTMSYVARI